MKKTLSALFLCLASFSALAAGQYVNNATVATNIPMNGLKAVNPENILVVDENPSALTIVITYADAAATVENWVFSSSADYNFVLDKFLTGYRASGAPFFYTSIYGSNGHRRVSYKAVTKIQCTQADPNVQFYAVSITLKTGLVVNSNGYSSSQCLSFTE